MFFFGLDNGISSTQLYTEFSSSSVKAGYL